MSLLKVTKGYSLRCFPELKERAKPAVYYKSKRQAANAYRAAANFLEKNPEQWQQGDLTNGRKGEKCKVCAVGALNLASLGDPEGLPAVRINPAYNSALGKSEVKEHPTTLGYLLQLQATEEAVLGRSIVEVNDDESSTVTDVIKGLRKVARALDHGAKMARNDDEFFVL